MKFINEISSKLSTIRGLQFFQILRYGGLFLTGIFLSKGPVSMLTIGAYESLMFIASAVSFFWVSGLLNGLLSNHAEQPESQKGAHLYNVALLLMLSGLLLSVVLLVFRSQLMHLIKGGQEALYPLLIVYILLNTPTYINEYILLLKEKNTQLIGYGLFLFIGTIAAVVLPLWLGFNLAVSMYCLITLSAVKLCLTYLWLRNHGSANYNPALMKDHLLYSLPLIFSLLISGSADYIDGFLVNLHYGSESFAVFRYGAKELPLALLLANALSSAMVPAIANSGHTDQSYAKLKKESLRLMHILFPISILLLITGKWLYPFVFRAEFSASVPFFNIYILLLISRMVFPQSIVLAGRQTGIIARIALVEILVNVVCSYLLMLKFGMAGIAWGTVIAFGIEKLLLAVHLRRNSGLKPTAYIPVKQWLFYSSFLIIAYLLCS